MRGESQSGLGLVGGGANLDDNGPSEFPHFTACDDERGSVTGCPAGCETKVGRGWQGAATRACRASARAADNEAKSKARCQLRYGASFSILQLRCIGASRPASAR